MSDVTSLLRPLGQTELRVHPLCLGGNVFGWTANEAQSFAVLDAYAEAGGNFIDTADVYSAWVPGNSGGESESIIGRWLASRGRQHQTIVATKVGSLPTAKGLSAANIQAAADASLRRLGVDRIDLYFAHIDDAATPLEETLGGFDALVKAGKVRYIAASNYSAERLAEALAISKRNGLVRYDVLQPHYNLAHRQDYEGALQDLAVLGAREGHAPMLELVNRLRRVAAEIFDGVLVAEPVGALDGVVHVPLPVVLAHVAERGGDAALRRDGVRAGRKHLGDAGGLQSRLGAADDGAQARAAGADHDHVVGVILDGIGAAVDVRGAVRAAVASHDLQSE